MSSRSQHVTNASLAARVGRRGCAARLAVEVAKNTPLMGMLGQEPGHPLLAERRSLCQERQQDLLFEYQVNFYRRLNVSNRGGDRIGIGTLTVESELGYLRSSV